MWWQTSAEIDAARHKAMALDQTRDKDRAARAEDCEVRAVDNERRLAHAEAYIASNPDMFPSPLGVRKDDHGKPPLHLIPPEFLYAIAEILDFGTKKYSPRNWEKGMNWSRMYRAALGHLFDWFMKKGPDPESGKSHLWHAACCVMFLVCYEIRSTGTDDRP